MADVKISALPASTTPLAGTEVLPIVQSGATVQVSVANLTAGRSVGASSLSVTGNTTLAAYTETVVPITLTSAGAVGTLVITAGTVLTATLTAGVPCTFAMPTSPTAGQSFVLRLTQAATSMTTATFTGVKWPSGTAPTITATASAVDIISFVYIGTAWYGNAAQAFA